MPQETPLRILLVEDNPGDARYIRELLEEADDLSGRALRTNGGILEERFGPIDGTTPDIVHEMRLEAGLERLQEESMDVVLLDLNLPDSDGLDTLTTVADHEEDVPIVVLTGLRDRERGVEALRRGAEEYLVKDEISSDLLVRSLYHAIERWARQREQERYETLIEESTDASAIFDPDRTLKYITPSVERMLGYEPEELVGEDVFEYVHHDDFETVEREFETLLANPDYEASTELQFRHADGSWVVLHARGRNLLDEPAIEGIIVYIHDITERREYERRLERQRERLVALNQLNGVVQGVTEAVIDRSTREEIEEITCQLLAASDSYEFAWIGEVDPEEQTVTPRTEAGVEGYVEEVDISTDPDDERSQGPTGRAIKTGEMQATPDVFSDPRFEPWREVAEEYGFRSSSAIPIRHEGTMYGVLNIYTDRIDAFRGEERTVIEHLGEIVGHAIAAAERKQALMSDAVIELELGIPDVFEAVDEPTISENTIHVDQVLSVAEEEFLLYGTASEETVTALEAQVDEVPHWEAVDVVGETTEDVRFELRLSEPPVLSVIASMGGSVEHAMIEEGDYRLTIQFPQGTDVRSVVDAIQESFPGADALARRQVTRPEGPSERLTRAWMERLTDRQRTALEAAYYSGLFEWPRDSSGEDVADSLGISPPTFHQHVRTAERKLFAALLEESSSSPTSE